MIQGMDYFERARAAVAPQASLRFKLLPRKPGTDMSHIRLEVVGATFAYDVPIAADHTFVLTRDATVRVTVESRTSRPAARAGCT